MTPTPATLRAALVETVRVLEAFRQQYDAKHDEVRITRHGWNDGVEPVLLLARDTLQRNAAAPDPRDATIERLTQALRVATHKPHDQDGEPVENFPVCSVCGAIQTGDADAPEGGLRRKAREVLNGHRKGDDETCRECAQVHPCHAWLLAYEIEHPLNVAAATSSADAGAGGLAEATALPRLPTLRCGTPIGSRWRCQMERGHRGGHWHPDLGPPDSPIASLSPFRRAERTPEAQRAWDRMQAARLQAADEGDEG